jgi:hypothetical protein
LEIPDAIFRRAKPLAAGRGIRLLQFVTEAVNDQLADCGKTTATPWMASFGKLQRLHKERARINRMIKEEVRTG